MLVIGEMVQAVAMFESVLMMVAKAVAGVPTCTERLVGKTAATNWLGESYSSALLRASLPAKAPSD